MMFKPEHYFLRVAALLSQRSRMPQKSPAGRELLRAVRLLRGEVRVTV